MAMPASCQERSRTRPRTAGARPLPPMAAMIRAAAQSRRPVTAAAGSWVKSRAARPAPIWTEMPPDRMRTVGGTRPRGPSLPAGAGRLRLASVAVLPAASYSQRKGGRQGDRGHRPGAQHQQVADGQAGAVLQHRAQPVGQRPAGQQPQPGPRPGREPGQREHDPAEAQEDQVEQVRAGQRGLRAQRAGQQQGQPAERGRARQHQQQHRDRHRAAAGVRLPARGQAHHHDQDHLQDLDGQHGQRLGPDQPAPLQRRRAEPLEHAVPALEPGRDGLAGERGGHDGQGQDARAPGSRSGRPGPKLISGSRPNAGQQQHRDDHHEQQLLAVAGQRAQLEAGLRGHHPGQRRRARRRGRPRPACPAVRPAVMTAAPARSARGTRPPACGSRSAGSAPAPRGPRTTR